MKKPCPDKRRALALHVVGELTRTEHDEIERHIELCAGCREYSTALHRVAKLYALSSADAVEMLDCRDFRQDFRRRFLLERSNRVWGLGQFLFF